MKYITVIDVGSYNIRTVISQIVEDQPPRIVGVGVFPSEGVRRGSVVEVEEVSHSIAKSIEMAELHSGVQVEEAYVSVGGIDLEFMEISGVVAVGLANGEVVESDIERAIEASQAINLPLNKEIIHIIPQSFQVDDQEKVKDPIGLNGVRLEMKGIAILAGSANLKNLSKCLENNEVEVINFIASPLASAQSALNKRQKELGAVLVELGGGVTSMIVYEEQSIVDMKVLPIGMGHVTNDIAIGLRTSVDVAEEVKLRYGSSLPSEIGKGDKINLEEINEEEESVVARKYVAEIMEARIEEIFYEVEKELKRIDRNGLLPAGSVLSGGGAYVHGIVDLAKDILRLPSQIGFPMEMSGLVDKVDGPSFNVVVGMIDWVVNNEESESGGNVTMKQKKDFVFSSLKNGVETIKNIFKKFL